MKVLMLNGSANFKGCTYTALEEIGNMLQAEGIEYEIFQLGSKPIRDCIGCAQCYEVGKCIFDDEEKIVQEFINKAKEADGFVFGTPVYYAHPTGRILSFLDRAFYTSSCGGTYPAFAHKPASVVASARRGGTTASLDVLAKYFTIAQMPMVASTYWNMVHGNKPEEVREDKEGLQTMRNIARNMAWLLKCIEAGKQNSVPLPKTEFGNKTNFIR
ncbi:flavodoxin family protein [bacterium]|nr:flavodoxin family protein [bacterium]